MTDLTRSIIRRLLHESPVLPNEALLTIRRIGQELQAAQQCRADGGPSCGVFTEEVAQALGLDQTYGYFRDSEGNVIDDDHAWNILPDGTIVDPTIEQFSDHVQQWPGYPDIAVVPPGHPFTQHYAA